MRIGVDIDNVLSNFNEVLLNDYLKSRSKSILSDLSKYPIMGSLIKILKNLKIGKNGK